MNTRYTASFTPQTPRFLSGVGCNVELDGTMSITSLAIWYVALFKAGGCGTTPWSMNYELLRPVKCSAVGGGYRPWNVPESLRLPESASTGLRDTCVLSLL